ncbi:MAG: hypothetical protein LBO08_03610 [Rickettsiales bacterium]|nr:hypothetical protein [Rickettsiales bacterium]
MKLKFGNKTIYELRGGKYRSDYGVVRGIVKICNDNQTGLFYNDSIIAHKLGAHVAAVDEINNKIQMCAELARLGALGKMMRYKSCQFYKFIGEVHENGGMLGRRITGESIYDMQAKLSQTIGLLDAAIDNSKKSDLDDYAKACIKNTAGQTNDCVKDISYAMLTNTEQFYEEYNKFCMAYFNHFDQNKLNKFI